MSKVLGIDYGDKKTGLAIGSRDDKISFPRETFRYKKKEELFDKIEQLIKDEEISKAVIGLPIGLDGRETEQTGRVKKFSDELKRRFKITVKFQDERLSSKEAQGVFVKKETKDEDALAAQIILQSYFDKNK